MITRITKHNRAKYEQLFEEANELLQLQDNARISGLKTYFSKIRTIYEKADDDNKPKFIRLPLDEDLFSIDLNSRQINIPASFKKAGLGVQGDKFAEIVYFSVDRYFDATDLSLTDIYVVWENSKGHKYIDKAYMPDTVSDTDKIIFGWGIGEEITDHPGAIKFSIMFTEGKMLDNLDTPEIDESQLLYRLNTLPATLNVNSGLVFDYHNPIIIPSSAQALNARIKNSPGFGYIEEASAPIIVMYAGYDWTTEDKEFELSQLLDNPATLDIVEAGLTILAYSEKAGLISYGLLKVDSENPDEVIASGAQYFPVQSKPAYHDKVTFYIYEDGKIRAINASELENLDALIAEHKIYEKIGFFPVTEPGVYKIRIHNLEDGAEKTIDTEKTVTIPYPTPIANVSIQSADGNDIYNQGVNKTLVANATLEDPNKVGVNEIEYKWNTGEHTKEIIISEPGKYSVQARSIRNGKASAYSEEAKLNIQAAAMPVEGVVITANKYYDEEDQQCLLEDGLTLSLTHSPIEQDSTIIISWERSPIADQPEWTVIENALTDTFVPEATGLYRASVVNKISDNNKTEPVYSSNIISVFGR